MFSFEMYCPVAFCRHKASLESESSILSPAQVDQLNSMIQDHFAASHDENRTMGSIKGVYCLLCKKVQWFTAPESGFTEAAKLHMAKAHVKEARLMQLMGGWTTEGDLPVFRQPGNTQVLFPAVKKEPPIKFWPELEITRLERAVIALEEIKKNCCDGLTACRGTKHSEACSCMIASRALEDLERIQDGKLPYSPTRPEAFKEAERGGGTEAPEGTEKDQEGDEKTSCS